MKTPKQIAPLSSKRLAQIRRDAKNAPIRCDPADSAVRDLLREVARLKRTESLLVSVCQNNNKTGAELVERLYERSVELEETKAKLATFYAVPPAPAATGGALTAILPSAITSQS